MFHILTAFITTFAMISYYAMAVNDGVGRNEINIKEGHRHTPDTTKTIYREVYWARYVDWSVTTPLLLLDLCLLAGLPGANILVAVVADLIMILTGLFAAFAVEEGPKWGWYAIACIAYLVVVYQLAFNGRGVVQNKDKKTATFFSAIAGFTLILWTVYPMYVPLFDLDSPSLTASSIWGIADGSRNINVDAEIIAYAVLDVLAKPVFGFWLLFTHDAMSEYVALDSFHGTMTDTILGAPLLKAFGHMVWSKMALSALATTMRVRKRALDLAIVRHDPLHMICTVPQEVRIGWK